MPIDYRQEAPQLLLDFLSYHETIKAHSQRTVDVFSGSAEFFPLPEADP